MSAPSELIEPTIVTDDIGIEHASAALEQLIADDARAGRRVDRALALLGHLVDADEQRVPMRS